MTFSFAMPSEAPSIPVIRRVVGDALRGLGATEECVDDLLVAISEACTNVVRHARATGRYEVTGRVDGGTCLLRVRDWGRGPRPAPQDHGPLGESGRGIGIMRALVDDLDIDSSPVHGTTVHLRKRLTWRDGALVRRLDRSPMPNAG